MPRGGQDIVAFDDLDTWQPGQCELDFRDLGVWRELQQKGRNLVGLEVGRADIGTGVLEPVGATRPCRPSACFCTRYATECDQLGQRSKVRK